MTENLIYFDIEWVIIEYLKKMNSLLKITKTKRSITIKGKLHLKQRDQSLLRRNCISNLKMFCSLSQNCKHCLDK